MGHTFFEEVILKHRESFVKLVPFDPLQDKLIPLDLTSANKDLTQEILNDTPAFTQYIQSQLQSSGARYAIGGYNEHRTMYSRSKVFDATDTGEEPRRLHLGLDIWGPAHTPVMAPLEGHIHSYAFNNQFGDYGATIILSHQLDGYPFHTLYGHLSLASIKNLSVGAFVEQGSVIGAFGIPVENGHWPPHLHFQIILDMQDWKGDFPGVCKYSERESYLINSPDPAELVQLNQYIKAPGK